METPNALHDCDFCGRPSELVNGLCEFCHDTHPAHHPHDINTGEHSVNDIGPALVVGESGPLLFGVMYRQCVAVDARFEPDPFKPFPVLVGRHAAPGIVKAHEVVPSYNRRRNDVGRVPDRRVVQEQVA